MKTHRYLIIAGVVTLAALLTLAIFTQLTQAQGPGPEPAAATAPQGVAAIAPGAIPIQGRLTNAAGSSLNGAYTITFSLYDTMTGTTALCGDTRVVTVTNGLFSDYMDGCYNDITGQRLWLGVKVESDSEMTPRQLVMPVPYAITLVPKAEISGTVGSNDAILDIDNYGTNGKGLRAEAQATTGVNYGVVGAAKSPDGYGGYFYNTGNGIGLYGQGTPGVLGENSGFGHGIVGRAGVFGAGIKGEGNLTSFGGWFTSTDFVALYVTSNSEDNHDAIELDGAADGGIDFSVTNGGDVKQALASNGLVKAGVYANCGTSPGAATRSFNNVGGTIVVTGTAVGQCTINLGFDVFDRFYVATSASNAARFVSCYTIISSQNELYCRNWDAAGAGQDGAIMVMVY